MSNSSAPPKIAPASGKLGILTPGLGAVATTFIAGVESIRRGLAKPIGSITQTIGKVDDYQTAIAAAVEEQTATTNEMARNVSEAAVGSGRIAEALVDVMTTMETTRSAVEESHHATDDLTRTAAQLTSMVDAFRV